MEQKAFKTSWVRAAAHSGHKQCRWVQEFFSGFLGNRRVGLGYPIDNIRIQGSKTGAWGA
jgi:hypothetical protein